MANEANRRGRALNRRRRPSLAALGIVIALITPSAWADQTEELSRLRQEAAQIRQSLEKLEAKIQAIENPLGNQGSHLDTRPSEHSSGATTQMQRAPNAGAANAPDAALTSISSLVEMKQNWLQVQRGTPEERVQKLLGKPEKVLRIDGNLVWYYVYRGIGRGSVFFDGNGKVSATQPPSLGWSIP